MQLHLHCLLRDTFQKSITEHRINRISRADNFFSDVSVCEFEFHFPCFIRVQSVARNHPTLPSRLTPSSFCASTANSIGSSLNTSLQKPLTISERESSSDRPRWRQ